MPLKICEDAAVKSRTNENKFFAVVSNLLKEKYAKSEDEWAIVIKNLCRPGFQIDALLIRQSAITIIDFKDYGGTINATEDDDWIAENENGKQVIKGGGRKGRNPFQQISSYKTELCRYIQYKSPFDQINLGQISGMVLFHQPIIPKVQFTHGGTLWFHLCALSTFIDTLDMIEEPEIFIHDQFYNSIPDTLKINGDIKEFNLENSKSSSIPNEEKNTEQENEINEKKSEIKQDDKKQPEHTNEYSNGNIPQKDLTNISSGFNISPRIKFFIALFTLLLIALIAGIIHFKEKENPPPPPLGTDSSIVISYRDLSSALINLVQHNNTQEGKRIAKEMFTQFFDDESAVYPVDENDEIRFEPLSGKDFLMDIYLTNDLMTIKLFNEIRNPKNGKIKTVEFYKERVRHVLEK